MLMRKSEELKANKNVQMLQFPLNSSVSMAVSASVRVHHGPVETIWPCLTKIRKFHAISTINTRQRKSTKIQNQVRDKSQFISIWLFSSIDNKNSTDYWITEIVAILYSWYGFVLYFYIAFRWFRKRAAAANLRDRNSPYYPLNNPHQQERSKRLFKELFIVGSALVLGTFIYRCIG